jgi:hypothetical protein
MGFPIDMKLIHTKILGMYCKNGGQKYRKASIFVWERGRERASLPTINYSIERE